MKCLVIGLENHLSIVHSFLDSHGTTFDPSSFQPPVNLPVLQELLHSEPLFDFKDVMLTDAAFWSSLRLMSTDFENDFERLDVCPVQSTIFDRPVNESSFPVAYANVAFAIVDHQWSPLKADEQTEFAKNSAVSKRGYKIEDGATKSSRSKRRSKQKQKKQKSLQADWSW
jgi:hypothetical protein